MRVMSLDCEFNQPSRKCIQIGAAVYDARSGQLIAEFETYVNPGEPIQPFITELTGITDRDVANAPKILEAYEMLHDFHTRNQVFRNPIVWGSGYRNDSQTLHEESGVLVENFMGFRVIDAKSILQSIQMFRSKQVGGGLQNACEKILKIGFEGDQHRALTDAKNTFRVWHHLVRKFGDLK